jgi:SNF2 family DNA or RNA helicase
VENSVVELWSLLDILMPGILGSRSAFSKRFGQDVERLRKIIRPLVLRRTKKAVAPELPPKEELVHHAEMGRRQAQVYESLRLHFADEVEHLIREGARGKSGMKILEAMLRLRQAAILPALVDRDFAEVPGAKLDVLYDRLIELRDEGNKALVFSQFNGVLDEVQLRLSGSGLGIFRLDGSTPRSRRERDIHGFQEVDGGAVFLISLKAGGVGINLTAADYVFLLDPWWNPAVESQAIDRAHRIGREGSVFAYRLVTVGTIEEKMLRLQEKKRLLSESLIRGESGALRELSNEDILGLFR